MSHGKEDEEPEGGKKNEQEEDELEGKEEDLEVVSNENSDGEIVTRRATKRVMTATEKALVIAVEENDDKEEPEGNKKDKAE